jgi:hypothetical protein
MITFFIGILIGIIFVMVDLSRNDSSLIKKYFIDTQKT